jgi:peptidoglycan/xylan/chitin deacetylase (PgdA/CDA1 family)
MKAGFSIEQKQDFKRVCAKFYNFVQTQRPLDLSIILNYHSIHPTNTFSTKPADFLQQMQYLANEFNVLSLPQFHKLRLDCEKLPDKTVIVTFDDGYENNYQYAFPILAKYRLPATIFLTTAFIDKNYDITQEHIAYRGLPPLTWENIIEMKKSGLSFGAHTHTHPILTNTTLEKAEQEIALSKKIIEERLTEPIKMFAYTLGQRNTFNNSIKALLRQHGFGCSTIWGTNNSKTDILALRRVRIDAQDTFDDFKSKVNGLWNFVALFQKIK